MLVYVKQPEFVQVTERKTEHAIGFQVFRLPEGDNRLADDNYSQVVWN